MLTIILLITLQGAMALQDSHGASQDKGVILFDVSHGVWRDPDHGEFTISAGYSILAQALRDEGFVVGENRASLSSGLSEAKVLVIVYLFFLSMRNCLRLIVASNLPRSDDPALSRDRYEFVQFPQMLAASVR
jgi:hypothetical protein